LPDFYLNITNYTYYSLKNKHTSPSAFPLPYTPFFKELSWSERSGSLHDEFEPVLPRFRTGNIQNPLPGMIHKASDAV